MKLNDYQAKLLRCAVRARDPRYSPIGGFSDAGPALDHLIQKRLVEHAGEFDKRLGIDRFHQRNGGWVATDKGVAALDLYDTAKHEEEWGR